MSMMTEIDKAIQEFEDEAYHHSLHPEISDKAKTTALAALYRVKALESELQDYQEIKKEVLEYRNAARLYGVDAHTMLMLAKSKIVTCADNIHMAERMEQLLKLFDYVPESLTDKDLEMALMYYDGDESKPYCDIVYWGLSVLRKYLKVRDECAEWRKNYVF